MAAPLAAPRPVWAVVPCTAHSHKAAPLPGARLRRRRDRCSCRATGHARHRLLRLHEVGSEQARAVAGASSEGRSLGAALLDPRAGGGRAGSRRAGSARAARQRAAPARHHTRNDLAVWNRAAPRHTRDDLARARASRSSPRTARSSPRAARGRPRAACRGCSRRPWPTPSSSHPPPPSSQSPWVTGTEVALVPPGTKAAPPAPVLLPSGTLLPPGMLPTLAPTPNPSGADGTSPNASWLAAAERGVACARTRQNL